MHICRSSRPLEMESCRGSVDSCQLSLHGDCLVRFFILFRSNKTCLVPCENRKKSGILIPVRLRNQKPILCCLTLMMAKTLLILIRPGRTISGQGVPKQFKKIFLKQFFTESWACTSHNSGCSTEYQEHPGPPGMPLYMSYE